MSEFFPTILSSTYTTLGKENTEPVLECPICMDTVERKINCVITECGHAFHTNCLLTNILHNGFGCPYCRSDMIDPKLLEEEEEEDEENRNDQLNNAFFLDDEEDDADSWRPTDEEDESEDDDERENPVIRNALRGMRLMFAREEGDGDIDDVSEDESEDSDNTNDEEEQDEEENDEEIDPGVRLTPTELERENIRLLDAHIPNMSYILRRFTSSAYNDLSYEELCGCLLRIIFCSDFPRSY